MASPEIENQKSIVVLLTQEPKEETLRAKDRAIDRTSNLQTQSGIFPTKPEQIAMQVAECAVPLPFIPIEFALFKGARVMRHSDARSQYARKFVALFHRHALGQIARLIHIRPTLHGDVIRE